jgi:hypothetical protein
MAFKHLDLTLVAGSQPLSSTRIAAKWVRLESETGNSDMQVGGSDVSATSYGFTVTAGPTASKDIGPHSGELPMTLDEIYVIGTVDDVLHVAYQT